MFVAQDAPLAKDEMDALIKTITRSDLIIAIIMIIIILFLSAIIISPGSYKSQDVSSWFLIVHDLCQLISSNSPTSFASRNPFNLDMQLCYA